MDKQHLKEMVGNGDLERVFQALLGYSKDQGEAWQNAVWVQYNRYKELEQEELQGTLSNEEEGLIKNRILSSLLTLIDGLPEPGKEEGISARPLYSHPEQKQPGILSRAKWLITGAVLLIILILGYTQLNPAGKGDRSSPSSPTQVATEENQAESHALRFPQGNEVTFLFSTGGETTYNLLSGQLKDAGGGVQHLSIRVRCSPRTGNGVNFWDDTFRLEVGHSGALLAPSSGLNEVVEDNSYKDGALLFELRQPFSSLSLAIINPWDKAYIRKLALEVE